MIKTSRRIKLTTSVFLILAFCIFLLVNPLGNSIFAAPKIRVFLDPGHGGSDTGAIGFGYYEKTANLDIALRTRARLEANGFEVVMRRTGDTNASLDDIVNMANRSGADIFVSIHNNAAVSPYAHGTETYWCANGVAGSNQLANLLQSNLVSQTGRANRGVRIIWPAFFTSRRSLPSGKVSSVSKILSPRYFSRYQPRRKAKWRMVGRFMKKE